MKIKLKKCKTCKLNFITYLSQDKKYCSRKCYWKDRSKRMKSGNIKIHLPKNMIGKNNPHYKNGH